MLGVSRSKMYELIGKGQIGVVRLGGSIRVPRRELDRVVTGSLAPSVSDR